MWRDAVAERLLYTPPYEVRNGKAMRIICPNCETSFEVPEGAIKEDGRKLKCSRCEHRWHQMPVEAEEEETEQPFAMFGTGEADKPPESGIEGAEGEDARGFGRMMAFGRKRAKKQGPSRPYILYFLLTLMVLIPATTLLARPVFVDLWPPSSKLYDAIGLHVSVPGEGLEIRDMGAWRKEQGPLRILVLSGKIRNRTDFQLTVPTLEAIVTDSDGVQVQRWVLPAKTTQLVPGETTEFEAEFAMPEQEASTITVTFTDEELQAEGSLGY